MASLIAKSFMSFAQLVTRSMTAFPPVLDEVGQHGEIVCSSWSGTEPNFLMVNDTIHVLEKITSDASDG